MRHAVLVIAFASLLTACQQPADAPADAGAPASAPAPVMPADAPPQEEVDPAAAAATPAVQTACRDDIGADASARLVQRCIAVSPATHPPCNAANPCQMIEDEIDRACEQYAADETRPAECSA